MKITFVNKELASLLGSIAKLTDQATIKVAVEEGVGKVVTASEGRDMFMLASIDIDIETTENIDDVEDIKLNLPSVTKLLKVIKAIKTENIQFNVTENNISYTGSDFRFKYHLLDDNIIHEERKSMDKLLAIDWDVTFTMKSETLKSIISYSKIFKDTSKLYIKSKDDVVAYEMTDKTMKNVDAIQIEGDEYEGILDFEFITDISTFNKFINPTKIELEFGMDDTYAMIKVVDNSNITLIYAMGSETN